MMGLGKQGSRVRKREDSKIKNLGTALSAKTNQQAKVAKANLRPINKGNPTTKLTQGSPRLAYFNHTRHVAACLAGWQYYSASGAFS
jgi:hypothetical protein